MTGIDPAARNGTCLDAWAVNVAEVPKAGLEARRSLDAASRAELAGAVAIVSVERFDVVYALKPKAGGRVTMSGTVSADITQSCVVTLEAVTAKLREVIDETFVPTDMIPADERGEKEILGSDDPVPIPDDGTLAVGHVIYEVFASALDPYPRKQDAALEHDEALGTAEAQAAAHPFAALEKLKAKR